MDKGAIPLNTAAELTKKQREMMEHALGLSYKKKPHRNRFYTASNDLDWNDLVAKGLAEKGGGWETDRRYFRVTFEGAKAIFSKPMSRKCFDDLS